VEALTRAVGEGGAPIAPLELFSAVPEGEPRIALDRQCRRMHVENYLRTGEERGWLFLNVDPYVAVEGRRFGSAFAGMLEAAGLAPHRVGIELLETPFADEASLAAAVDYYRQLGCVIVIDDFGAGSSNFDRIWRLKPDIVKIDREMTRRVAVEPLARRMFAGIVALLHEAGALVCVEGIETEAEALCATEASADLMQGNYFAAPGAPAPDEAACREMFGRLFGTHRSDSMRLHARRLASLQRYFDAVTDAAREMSAGAREYPAALEPLLELPWVQRCYLIRSDGSQAGANVEAERNAAARDRRLDPMRPAAGTNWQNKPYFRRAVEAPGRIQMTRPYLSVTGPKLCVTLSFAFFAQDSLQVVCADLDYQSLAGQGLTFEPD
jgi:EAL domain-containing protein (putative c-di-GMP-specific phosphodiesterase class I)